MKTTTLQFASVLMIFLLLSSGLKATSDVSFFIDCPDPVTLDCKDELWDLSMYGNATYTTNYITYDAGTPVTEYFLNSCNIGIIKRTWTVEDQYWNQYSCSQIITVDGPDSEELDVTWPESPLSVEGCNPNISPDVTGYPSYINTNPCAMIGTNYTDTEFIFGPQCKKILRKWHIIDWCTYNPDLGGVGEYFFNQTIKVSDASVPTHTELDTLIVGATNCLDMYVEVPELDLPPSSCGGEFTISHNSVYADTPGVNASEVYPIGTHTVGFVVNYGCSLKKFFYQTIVVENIANPNPYCYAKITTVLCGVDTNGDGEIDNGKVEIWAKDFDLGSSNNCASGMLQYSFSPDVNHTHEMFTCDHLGDNTLNMYVTDALGNQNYCIVTLEIQNNSNIPNCAAELTESQNHDYQISGEVVPLLESQSQQARISLKSVETDTLSLLTQDTTYLEIGVDSTLLADGTLVLGTLYDTIIINSIDTIIAQAEVNVDASLDGTFAIDHIELMGDYTLQPVIDSYDVDLVTAKDAEILSAHLWGNVQLTDPYMLLAADLDDNGIVEETDFYLLMEIVRFRKFPESIEKYYKTIDVKHLNKSGEFVSMIQIEDFDSTLEENNFLALLKGDISSLVDAAASTGLNVDVASDIAQEDTHAVKFRDGDNREKLDNIALSPNPFHSNLMITLDSPANQILSVEIYNVVGRLVGSQELHAVKGSNVLEVNAQQFGHAGIYFIKLQSELSNESSHFTVIKE